MKTTATNRKLRLLITGIRSGSLVPRPEFQRRLVWATRHKVYFIETVLRGLPFPEIYVAAGNVDPVSAEGTEMLVDGQQRISTLFEYFTASPNLVLPKSVPTYAELNPEEQVGFLEYDVVVRDLGRLSLERIREVFTRINSTNYALNPMEVNNARFDGAFKLFGERLVNHTFFTSAEVFKAADVRRMNDLRFALTLAVTVMSTYFNRDDELQSYLQRYNDEFPEEKTVTDELDKVFTVVRECRFPPKSRVWRKPDLFTLLVELHRIIVREKKAVDPEQLRERVLRFVKELNQMKTAEIVSDELVLYYQASIQATNDRGSRIIRGDIVYRLITGQLDHTVRLDVPQ